MRQSQDLSTTMFHNLILLSVLSYTWSHTFFLFKPPTLLRIPHCFPTYIWSQDPHHHLQLPVLSLSLSLSSTALLDTTFFCEFLQFLPQLGPPGSRHHSSFCVSLLGFSLHVSQCKPSCLLEQDFADSPRIILISWNH